MYCNACYRYEGSINDLPEAVTTLISDFLDECLSDDEIHRLERILASCDAARNYLAERLALECTLHSIFQQDDHGA